MVNFLEEFEKFCETPNRKSGKPKSYNRSIKYFYEFLNRLGLQYGKGFKDKVI